jgi:glycerate 2-kinase
MRVLVAPDKLKGSLTAAAAAAALAAGVTRVFPEAEVELCPLADGGEGTIDALHCQLGGTLDTTRVHSGSGRQCTARILWLEPGPRAIIESADALGRAGSGDRLDPRATTSFGVGELVRRALEGGARQVVIGLGGSVTTDGGAGLAQALGARFEGAPTPITGADLLRVVAINLAGLDRRLGDADLVAACDVMSPLTGPSGAALVYAAQKGASEEQARELDRALQHLAELVPGADPSSPGSGAAGGAGFGIVALLAGRAVSGADFVLDAIDFDRRLAGADLVLTAEGRLDAQTLAGKLVARVAARAGRAGVPSLAVVGRLELRDDELAGLGLAGVRALVDGTTSEADAMAHAAELLAERAAELVRTACGA